MSTTKDKKPTLAGQRIRSRKRDEKVKYDPEGFRDEIVKGLGDSQDDFDKASKYLDTAGNNLDYHRYGECLFDVLLAGGIIAPGGEIQGEPNKLSVFELPDAEEPIRSFAQLFQKLIRRYKYLQVTLEDDVGKILKFLKTFPPENRIKLAKFLGCLFSLNLIGVKPLESLTADALVKEGISLEFATALFRSWLRDTPMSSIAPSLRKEKIDILEFCPPSKRTLENFRAHCMEAGGLDDLVAWQASQQTRDQQRQLQKEVMELLASDTPHAQIIERVRASLDRNAMSESDVVDRVFTAVMESVEWNKKPDLIADQALRHFKIHAPLLAAFAKSVSAQVALMVRLQVYCYDNQTFLKLFNRIVVLLYKADVLSEEAILDWYAKSHSSKGRSVFLEQMTQMVEWLRNAEEESSEEEEEK